MYKNIDFTKNGGFPVTQDTLAFMQGGYNETIAALASVYGQYVILSGVNDLGSTYSDGWVIFAGELVKFVGGIKTARVAIEETSGSETFGDDSVNAVYFTRVAKCVTIGGVLFSDFERIKYETTIINTTESNGSGITVNVVTGGAFAYNSDTYKYSYYVDKKICHLSFVATFTVIDGAELDQINIPLPVSLLKDTTVSDDFAFRGVARLIAIFSVTNYEVFEVVSNKDNSEGQRLVLYRAGGGSETMVFPTGAIVTLKGSIVFKLA